MTGACYLLETKGKKILVDCGAYQGEGVEEKNREPFLFNPKEIDWVILTHAHLDHIGRLPKLIKEGFEGKIFSTLPTRDFTKLILEDSVKILEEKARKAGILPLFGFNEMDQVMRHFEAVEYHEVKKLAWGISFKFYDAGHVLGSAIAEIEAEGKKIVFSGDLGNAAMPLLPEPDQIKEADYIIVESTYGDRNHESLLESKDMIENAVEDAVARRGVLMIPSFALERAQQIIYYLNDLVERKRIPQIPVFLDSPLACSMTDVYKKYFRYYSNEAKKRIESGDDIFKFPGLVFSASGRDSKKINAVDPPKIIIAGSGMSQGGRIVHHEQRYLPDEKSILLLVAYQAQGTIGRKISDGAKSVEIFDQPVEAKAEVRKISGYSSHADQKFLMEWIAGFQKPVCAADKKKKGRVKKVFVVHGEEKPAATLAGLIRDELGIEAVAAKEGQEEKL
ncbi:MAG: RNA-metabolising metallo-beta-lactamase [Parcubacteria group bacterium GW2011_GWA1_42_7]|nr:MAG: RNA-metabolising metallo-beta-lactamase [Parcubacteria group bacterium GW2011_GWA1_42_7]